MTQGAAMGLRPHRRNLVLWRQSAGSAGRHASAPFTPPARTRRIRRWIRTGVLLTIVSLMPLAHEVRLRWRPVLAGVVLTVAGVIYRAEPAGVILLPGLLFLVSAPFIPASPKADRMRHAKLTHELAGYSTPAQRRDLEATLDRYPDDVTDEMRDILAGQTVVGGAIRIPGA